MSESGDGGAGPTEVGRILLALADLAPRPAAPDLDVTRAATSPVLWLAEQTARLSTRDAVVARLAALDRLHQHERLLRWGWAFVYGSVERDGVQRPVRLPLLTTPVRLVGSSRALHVEPAGDTTLTPLIADEALAASLESRALNDLVNADWMRQAATGAGLPVSAVHGPQEWTAEEVRSGRWRQRLGEARVGVLLGALYVARDATNPDQASTLRTWAQRPGLESSALRAVYGSTTDGAPDEEPVRSPLPLNAAQREIVRRTRTEPLTVVSGPPGNGKSHTVVAAAIDAVDRGQSVLVATQSRYAAEVLGDLLRRYPGPTPVLFGDAEKRAAIVTELSAGLDSGYADGVLDADADAVEEAATRVRTLESAALAALAREGRAERAAGWQPLLSELFVDAPAAADAGLDLARAGALAERAAAPDTGRLARWRRRRAERALRRTLRAGAAVPLVRLRTALEAAGDVRAGAELAARGGTDLRGTWHELVRADDALAGAVGTAIGHRARSRRRWNGDARRTVAALTVALRSGRNRRREALAAMDGPALVRALPLWVGTVTDVEDLLPPRAGLFDLVILDEASHIDQLRAAPVLARARRALVVGDPRQLRFVSFVADVDVARVLARHELTALADRLDVRRSSAYDVAAGAAATTWLTEHYRCLPHLIGFSARHFYGERLALVTRHPRNDSADLIEVRHVAGTRSPDGSVPAEVAAAVEAVRELDKDGRTGIAVVSPFRSQADALEAALSEAFELEDIDRLRLRVGTVHGFQGSEADHVVISVGLVDADGPTRRRFVNDPHLFNVLITRARRGVLVLTSLTAPDGLLGEYLRYGATPPAAPPDAVPVLAWPAELAAELRGIGRPVHTGYPVGRSSVDLCLGDGDAAVGLLCALHPDGPAAHVERQRTLARAGWTLRDAFPTRWDGNPARGAIELAEEFPARVT
jgi:hypothetical protein